MYRPISLMIVVLDTGIYNAAFAIDLDPNSTVWVNASAIRQMAKGSNS